MKNAEIKDIVKESYGRVALHGKEGSCCGGSSFDYAKSIGYSQEELENITGGENLSLGCGNPTSLADLKEGETVIDLGSGTGFDCIIAASKVGKKGKIIGIDMTPEMIERARQNVAKSGLKNIEFFLSEIETLPVESSTVDVIISNCVINLSADKQKAYDEAYRVLKEGGRIAISDMALTKDLPAEIRDNIRAYTGCVAGAVLVDEYKKIVEASGFRDVRITIKASAGCMINQTKDPFGKAILESIKDDKSFLDDVVSIYVEAKK